jgi:hypothetical protein
LSITLPSSLPALMTMRYLSFISYTISSTTFSTKGIFCFWPSKRAQNISAKAGNKGGIVSSNPIGI